MFVLVAGGVNRMPPEIEKATNGINSSCNFIGQAQYLMMFEVLCDITFYVAWYSKQVYAARLGLLRWFWFYVDSG